MHPEFRIEILSPHWIENGDPKDDQCLHSPLLVQIGNEIVSDEKSGDWTISTTGLYLLRSLSQGYKPGFYASQLLPCCGFSMLELEGFKDVQILGCPNGIDWNIEVNGAKVKHWTESGAQAEIDMEDYRQTVFSFVQRVESEYQRAQPKNAPQESESIGGVKLFWKEWKELKARYEPP